MAKDKLGGLWKCQYAPREKALLCKLNAKAKAKWKKAPMIKKIMIIDKFQSKGYFD